MMGPVGGRYVIIELRGRLGNQLWEFASGLAIARANNAELLFDTTEIGPFDVLLQQLVGDTFREATVAQQLRVGRLPWPNRWRRVFQPLLKDVVNGVRRVRGRTPAALFINQPDSKWVPEWLSLDPPVHISHYLQSTYFFADLVDEVFATIQFPPGTPQLPSELAEDKIGPTVAISFRRSDFEPEYRLSLEYYERAIGRLGELTDLTDATFLLFSEDCDFVELAEPWLAKFGAVRNVFEIDGGPLAQLSLMADCDHVIMANSSFAFWGAWLGDRRHGGVTDRVVIFPDSLDPRDGHMDPAWRVLDAARRDR